MFKRQSWAEKLIFFILGVAFAGFVFFGPLPSSHRVNWLKTLLENGPTPLVDHHPMAGIRNLKWEQFIDEPTMAIYGPAGVFPIEANMVADICAYDILEWESIFYEDRIEFGMTLTKEAEASLLSYLVKTSDGPIIIIIDDVKADSDYINFEDLNNLKRMLSNGEELAPHISLSFSPNTMHNAAELMGRLYSDRAITDCSAINVDIFEHELFKLFTKEQQAWVRWDPY